MQLHGPDPRIRPRETPEAETIIKDVPGDDSSQLVERIRAGHPGAWRELVGQHEPRLRRIARRHRLSGQDADDAIQLTWLRCLEHLDQLTQTDRLQAWLGTICRRECLRLATKEKREVTLGETAVTDLIDSRQSQPDPAAEAVHRDNHARLNQAITTLPDRQRFVLRELLDPAGRSYHEVSGRLGVPVGSLGPTWQRALVRLRHDPALAGLDPAS